MIEQIKRIIRMALPNLSEQTLCQIIAKLQDSGLESIQDLQYVQQEDLADLLPVIQCRKLLHVFKLESFQVPWEQMPLKICSAIVDGKRPTPVERRQMIRVLADEIRRFDSNPTRSQCKTVVQNIIRQYPKRFADMNSDGSLLCGGYTSLLIQLKNRIENLNRDGSFSRHRTTTGKRDLKNKRPFIFMPRYIYEHFQLLTDIDVLRSLELHIEECGKVIQDYFKDKSTNKDVKNILSNGDDDDELAFRVVQLLMAHFGEDRDGLILLTDESTTAAGVEMSLNVPSSPRLILSVSDTTGKIVINGWMITLEGRVISESITPSFTTGLAAVFAIYYNFNLQYQVEAECTLEFIQRYDSFNLD
nr:uncharacterized protein LOC133587116 [Nerophis lumbriciformis]